MEGGEIIGIGAVAIALISGLSGLLLKVLRDHREERDKMFSHLTVLSQASIEANTKSSIALESFRKSVDEGILATKENSRITQETGRLTRETKDAMTALIMETKDSFSSALIEILKHRDELK